MSVYFAYLNTLLRGREKDVWIYRSLSRELHLILKMPIKCVEAGPQKVVKPVFQTLENLSKTFKQRTP